MREWKIKLNLFVSATLDTFFAGFLLFSLKTFEKPLHEILGLVRYFLGEGKTITKKLNY